MQPYSDPALSALIASLFFSMLIVLTGRWHGHLSFDSPIGVQRQHHVTTPRVGGIALWMGLFIGYLACIADHSLCASMLLAGTPVFLVGLLEDVSKSVSVRTRLLVSMAGGVLGWWYTGYSLNHLHWPMLDTLLSSAVPAVLLTGFAVAGTTHAVNIIDGFNGMAAGTVLITTSAFLLLAWDGGDQELVMACVVFMGALFGFLVVNWPSGKLFLGDSGAYLAGSSLGWLAVLLNARLPDISAWALLLICAYPVQEVLFSIWRRRARQKHWGHPDRLHLHSLVGRRLVRAHMPIASPTVRNSITGLIMLTANLLPVSWALAWPNHNGALLTGLLFSALLYQLFYHRLTRFRWVPMAQQTDSKAPTW
ncbi:MAG: glycosyltransferase family 4 protein [Hydrogenophaga sp.]|uniref:MraY family glycosyltransferase n=1 Tax=Hydrogenophaga sp. TaxID=1904254 RepID=UPI0025C6DC07|nr:glycosyltransferase [Hydrogenophaga sp.]MBT9550665.1 glycosyltransferase family 4 protein [Hydrogenophaga sp.]